MRWVWVGMRRESRGRIDRFMYADVDADVDARYRIACLWICGNLVVSILAEASSTDP